MADVTHIYGNEIVDAAARQDVNQLKEDLDDVETALETKAEVDGYYEDMTVGDAEQLVSTVTNADDTPYNFRTTAGSVDVGDREYVDAIVGGTIAWNQMINHGNFDASGSWFEYACTYTFADGVATVTPTDAISRIFQTRAVVLGHKYFMIATFKGTSGEGNAMLSWYGGVNVFVPFTGSWQTISMIVNNTFQTSDVWQLHYGSSSNSNKVPYMVKDAMCFDLTQMLGATIADYIYSLEQATAGAGVAWLKANAPKIFNGEYIPFNAGTLQSVVGLSEKRNTGLNQWDEQLEVGTYSNIDGTKATDYSRLRCKDKIPCVPNTAYFYSCNTGAYTGNLTILFYDADENFISYYNFNPDHLFTTPDNCHYMTFYTGTAYGTTYNHDICINLHWDGEKDGTYEPYTLHTYAFDPTVELRGVPKLKDGKMYFDGDRYLPDGTVQRRYGIVDLGTLDYVADLGANRFYTTGLSSLAKGSGNLVSSGFIQTINLADITGTAQTKGLMFITASGNISFSPSTYTDKDTFKTAMSGVMLLYELATPTTETAEPYQQTQICDDFGTEEFISTSPVPVGHNTRYAPNLRAKLEISPDSPDGDGIYVVQQTNGENTYVSLGSTTVIQGILARLTALEGNTNEG